MFILQAPQNGAVGDFIQTCLYLNILCQLIKQLFRA